MQPRISLVVPAFEEERLLPRLLDSVDAASRRFSADAAAVETIVVDNLSCDATARIAAERGCRVLSCPVRSIAAVRNAGAAAARAPWLAFVDADSQLHADTFGLIAAALDDPAVVGGATGIRLERRSPGILVTYAMVLPMVTLLGLDTGVVFCRAADFAAVGRFDESRLLAEDVAFQLALKKLGRSRGQRFLRATAAPALLSTRKFDEHGDWHYFTSMPQALAAALFGGAALTRLARRFWYMDRR
jgi:glycosyltransferase involved in cell wall biosynthesis